KEKGNQVRSVLKKRIDSEMTRRTGMAFRKAYGYNNKGLKRIEGVHEGLVGAEEGASYEYKSFENSFENYNSGLQKLGLKPGRDDINLAVAMELKNRCEEALKAAVKLLDHGVEEGPAKKAVEAAREALETDLHLLEHTISTRLDDENARIRFDELFEEGTPDKGKGPGAGADGDRGDTGSDDEGSRDAGSEGGAE
nr:hypothetical protein [Lachnospiraceae bacterium]